MLHCRALRSSLVTFNNILQTGDPATGLYSQYGFPPPRKKMAKTFSGASAQDWNWSLSTSAWDYLTRGMDLSLTRMELVVGSASQTSRPCGDMQKKGVTGRRGRRSRESPCAYWGTLGTRWSTRSRELRCSAGVGHNVDDGRKAGVSNSC